MLGAGRASKETEECEYRQHDCDNHETPIIALSAYAFEENIREAKAAGCDEFMSKPFRVENLIEMVRKYID